MKNHALLLSANTTIFFCIFAFFNSYAQPCNLTVNAGPDIQVCFPGGMAQLNGAVTGNYDFIAWAPSPGLNDTTILTPTANVSTTSTYTLSAFQPASANLFVNGDFEQGNVGFTSDYNFTQPVGLIFPGTYSLVTSPSVVSSTFPSCVDHTTGTGLMMIVNGGLNLDENIYCQSVNVSPNTYYEFSYWIMNINPLAPSINQTTVNGQPLGGLYISPPFTGCVWQQVTQVWFSGNNTTATFCITNQAQNGLLGNDFILDDFSLIEYCEVTDDVTVEVLPPLESTQNIVICDGECFTIGNTNYCSDISTTQVITNNIGCDSTVNLNLEVLQPAANIAPPATITCIAPVVTLSAQSSTSDPAAIVTYDWTGPFGFTSTLQNPTVSFPGTYTLTVTHSLNGVTCSATTTVEVEEDTEVPTADAGPDIFITCPNPVDSLDGSNSSTGPDFSYSWTGPFGFSSDQLQPQAGPEGTYTIIVTDNTNGCFDFSTTEVSVQIDTPDIQVFDDTLTCDQPSVSLQGNSNTPNVTYLWEGPNGFQSTIPDTIVSDTGLYVLTITDSIGCEAIDTATISGNFIQDSIPVQIDTIVNCIFSSVDTLILTDSIGCDSLILITINQFSTPDSTFFIEVSCNPLDSGLVIDTFQNSLGCDSLIFTQTTFVPLDTTFIFGQSCDPALADTSVQVFITTDGCDSIVINQVELLQTDSVFLFSTTCNPDSAGTFFDTLSNNTGCDSLIITQVNLLPTDTTFSTQITCDTSAAGTFIDTFANQFGCDSFLITEVQFVPPDTTFLFDQSCDPIQSGVDVQTFLTPQGCDSIVVTQTNLLPTDSTFFTTISCDPNQAQLIVDTLQNTFGCDSFIFTQTQFIPLDTTFLFDQSCNPTQTGVDVQTFLTPQGCDSLVVTQTNLLPTDSTFFTTISCDPNQAQLIVDTLQNTFGCDSLIFTQTQFIPLDTTFLFDQSCNPTQTGVDVQTFLTPQGCDSLVVTQTNLLPTDSTFFTTTSCDPNQAQLIIDTLQNTFGCDSLIFTQTQFIPLDTTFLFDQSCDPTQSGVDIQTFLTPQGCDSIVVTQTSLLPTDSTFFTNITCEPNQAGLFVDTLQNNSGCDSFLFNQVLFQPLDTTFLTGATCATADTGLFIQTLPSAEGCDSVVVTNISLLPSDTLFMAETSCSPADTGILISSYVNQFGCDSTIIAITTLLPTTASMIALDFCEGDTLFINGNPITNTVSFVDTLFGAAVNGCDSIITYTITQFPVIEQSFVQTICQGESVLFGDDLLTSTGTYTDTLPGLVGCDTINTLELLVGDTHFVDLGVITLCPGETFNFNGQMIGSSGVFIMNDTTALGCDSTLTVEIVAEEIATLSVRDTACEGEFIELFGNSYSSATPIDTITLKNSQGCDSLIIDIALHFRSVFGLVSTKEPRCFEDEDGRLVIYRVNPGQPPYAWQIEETGASGKFSFVPAIIEPVAPGSYTFTLVDSFGCVHQQEVFIPEAPKLEVDLEESLTIRLGDSIELEPLPNFLPFAVNWTPPTGLSCDTCLMPMAAPTTQIAYNVVLTDSSGCTIEDAITIFVNTQKEVFIPNIFSPNGDGFNDWLTVYANPSQVSNIDRFVIFDRWGGQVFEATNLPPNDNSLGWDGTMRGKEVNPGVYTYFAEITFVDGEVEVIRGSVTVVR